jgi:hypothetical protein
VKTKLLFWLALAMAVLGMHSSEGTLFYFFALHLSMLLIGCLLQRREKRGRKTDRAGASSSRPTAAVAKAKAA